MNFLLFNFSNSEIEHFPIDTCSWNTDLKKNANISSVDKEENGNLVNYSHHAEFGVYSRFTASLFLVRFFNICLVPIFAGLYLNYKSKEMSYFVLTTENSESKFLFCLKL